MRCRTRTTASFYLNSGFRYHVSSLVTTAQELAISHEVCRRSYGTWQLPNGSTRSSRGLEQRICLQLGPQQQVAYVDCASYHETPMKSTVEQPPTTTDTPREAAFESAVFGTHEDLHLTMKLSQCFKHSTHQVKILQTKSTYGFLLKVGDGFVFSLAAPQRRCRSWREALHPTLQGLQPLLGGSFQTSREGECLWAEH